MNGLVVRVSSAWRPLATEADPGTGAAPASPPRRYAVTGPRNPRALVLRHINLASTQVDLTDSKHPFSPASLEKIVSRPRSRRSRLVWSSLNETSLGEAVQRRTRVRAR